MTTNIKSFLKKPNNQFEINYLQIRKWVGWLGILLPFVVSLGTIIFCRQLILKESVSNYYYSSMGNVFTGILCGVALFLYSYKGPQRLDNYVSSLAAVFALGVAFFPMNVYKPECCDVIYRAAQSWRDKVHYGSAAGLFIIFGYMSLFLFTKTHVNKKMTPQKRKRNVIYYVCGITIWFFCLLLALFKFSIFHPFLYSTFIIETIMLVAFGFSWLVKGEQILKDK